LAQDPRHSHANRANYYRTTPKAQTAIMAAASRVLLLALAAYASSAVMVQHVSDSCECLAWQDAFQKGADCSSMGDETCAKFFMELPNEQFCLNENFGHTDPKQWCYVSSSCESAENLQWAKSISHDVKFKWCSAEEAKLGDKAPMELKAWTAANNLEVGLAVHFAYPTWQSEKLTKDVLSFFGVTLPADAPAAEFKSASLTPVLRQRLQKQADAGRPTLIISTAGHPPFGIMRGKELYWLNFSDEQLELLKKGKDFFSHKGTMNALKCVAGCDEVVPAWMSPINAFVR